jgi:hypothetical protein
MREVLWFGCDLFPVKLKCKFGGRSGDAGGGN